MIRIINLFPKEFTKTFYPQNEQGFLRLINNNLLLLIFNYLNVDDLFKICTIHSKFYNIFRQKLRKWKYAIIPLSRKFNFKYTYNEKTEEIEEFKNDGIFEMDVEHKGLYIQFKNEKITYYSIACEFDWADKGNPYQCPLERCRNPIIINKTPHLIGYNFAYLNFWFDCIYEGTYKFYLYHFIELCQLDFMLTIMIGERQIYSKKYPNVLMHSNCMEYQKFGKIKGNSHGKYFKYYDYWIKKKREYCSSNAFEENKYDEYDYDYAKKMKDFDEDASIMKSKKIKLFKQFICDFTVTKDDLLGCDKGQILFIQFTPSNDGKMSGLYIHGGILERTDIEIKMK